MESTEHITSLDGTEGGKYIVTTYSGTKHFIDLDRYIDIRNAVLGHEWGPEGIGFGKITPDGEPFHFHYIKDCTVGKRMRLDSFGEWRISSKIVSIEPVE